MDKQQLIQEIKTLMQANAQRERLRALNIVRTVQTELLKTAASRKSIVGSDYLVGMREFAAAEMRTTGNAIAGLNALSHATKETIEDVVNADLEASSTFQTIHDLIEQYTKEAIC